MRLDGIRIFLAPDDAAGGGASDSGDTSSGDAATDLADSYHIEDQGEGWSDDVANAPFKLPSSKKSEGEGEEEPESKTGKDEESAELDEATLLRAEHFGFSKEIAVSLGDKLPLVLSAFGKQVLAEGEHLRQGQATGQPKQPEQSPAAQAVQQAKPPEAPIPGDVFENWQTGLAKQLEEQGYEADAAKVLAGSMKDLAGHLSQHIASQFTGKLDRLEAAENSRVQRDVETRLEAKLRELEPETFGKRPAKGTPEYDAAAKVWDVVYDAMHTMAFGLRARGLPVPEVEELATEVYQQKFSDKLANQVRSKIKSTLKKQGPVKKPAQRNNAPAGKSPEAKAVANIAKKLEEKGFGPHMD